MYYLQSRYYDPAIGRFANADIVTNIAANGNLISYNLYSYCGNNPIDRKDTSGDIWGIATLASAAVGGLISAAADIAVQIATTGSVDIGQTVIAGVSGAISGACALIPGGKTLTTVFSGVLNAGLSAGSYVVNQMRKGDSIDTGDLLINTASGLVAGIAGNLFRYKSTGAIREVGEKLLDKANKKFANAMASGLKSTVKRSLQYWDRGATAIVNYSIRAGVNSGFGSTVGTVASAAIQRKKLEIMERRLAM